jgi:hypothetical protein
MSHRRAKRERQRFAFVSTTGLLACACPNCGAALESVTGAIIGEADGQVPPRPVVPEPGTPTVCGHCATLLVFDSQMRVRRPTPELESRLLAEQPLLRQTQQWIRDKLQ